MSFLVLQVALLAAAVIGAGADSSAIPAQSSGPHMSALRDTIGADVAGVEDSLGFRIEPFCAHVWPNTVVRFRVRVANHSSRAIFLVSPPLGGVRKAPRVTSRVLAPNGVVAAKGPESFYVGGQEMKANDFILVPAGKQVDLFGPRGYVDPSWDGSVPGRYVERFTYSTEEANPRLWLGTFQPDSLDADWRARFRRVPRVELRAECSIDVQQR